MADARSLLRARRQESEARISHPYASYASTGQLRCSACGISIKTAAMWEGHIGSKAHRVAVRNMKALEEAERMKEMKKLGKRKAEAGDEMDVDDARAPQNGTNIVKKRKTSVEPDGVRPSPQAGALPADFFSDPSQAPVLSTLDEEDEDSQAVPPEPPAKDQPKSQIDLEWEQFQASLLATTIVEEEQEDDRRAAFERATVAAEPELVATNANGFPEGVTGDANGAALEEKEEETEEEKRLRKEQEERELIMDRILEEERAQEEADERVGRLKARVEALKKAREARRKTPKT
ncbi:hypothetical protein ACEPAF_8589 [Sanghuangporus sanghuang]